MELTPQEKHKLRCKEYRDSGKYKEAVDRFKAKNPEAGKIANKKWRDKNAEHVRKYHLMRTYGITTEEFELMWEKQNGKCDICDAQLQRDQSTHVDHCHDSKAVRGLLCRACNTGIGSFEDDIEVLRMAIQYIEKHQTTKKAP